LQDPIDHIGIFENVVATDSSEQSVPNLSDESSRPKHRRVELNRSVKSYANGIDSRVREETLHCAQKNITDSGLSCFLSPGLRRLRCKGQVSGPIDHKERLALNPDVSTIVKGGEQPTNMVQVVLVRVTLLHQYLPPGPVPAPRPGFIGPA